MTTPKIAYPDCPTCGHNATPDNSRWLEWLITELDSLRARLNHAERLHRVAQEQLAAARPIVWAAITGRTDGPPKGRPE